MFLFVYSLMMSIHIFLFMILMNGFNMIIGQVLIINEIFCSLRSSFVKPIQIVLKISINQLKDKEIMSGLVFMLINFTVFAFIILMNYSIY